MAPRIERIGVLQDFLAAREMQEEAFLAGDYVSWKSAAEAEKTILERVMEWSDRCDVCGGCLSESDQLAYLFMCSDCFDLEQCDLAEMIRSLNEQCGTADQN